MTKIIVNGAVNRFNNIQFILYAFIQGNNNVPSTSLFEQRNCFVPYKEDKLHGDFIILLKTLLTKFCEEW